MSFDASLTDVSTPIICLLPDSDRYPGSSVCSGASDVSLTAPLQREGSRSDRVKPSGTSSGQWVTNTMAAPLRAAIVSMMRRTAFLYDASRP